MVRRSVLVIEDEAVVALFLSDILCDLSDEVCTVAASGREGLELPAQHRLDARFDIPSILLSGDPNAPLDARSKRVALNKPYTPDQLEAAPADAFAQT